MLPYLYNNNSFAVSFFLFTFVFPFYEFIETEYHDKNKRRITKHPQPVLPE